MVKKITLLFFITSSVFAFTQAELTVTAPSPTTGTALRAPNGTTDHTSIRGHLIVLASELTNLPSSTSLTKLGFAYDGGTNTPAAGTITFYLENTSDNTNLKSTTWATAISTMTSVYSSTYNIPVGATAATTDVTLSSPFVYTGGSVYVAYEYSGTTFAATAAVNSAQNALAGGVKMANSNTTTQPATLTGSSAFRPSVRFTFANPYTNEIQVVGFTMDNGKFNKTAAVTQSLIATIKNNSGGALTNIPVSLNITGTNPSSATQSVPALAAGASTTLTFSGITATNVGADTVKVSVPADEFNANNLATEVRRVSCDTLGVTPANKTATGSIGFNTGAGVLANRYQLPAGPPLNAKKVSFTVSDNANTASNTVKGVLINSAGVIIDSTAPRVITAAEIGTVIEMSFISGSANLSNTDFYVGFRQTANAVGYFPLATATSPVTVANRFYSFPAFGGDTTSYTSFGFFLIDVVLKPRLTLNSNAIGGQVCANNSVNFTATSGYANYEFFRDNVSVASSSSNTYTHVPVGTQTYSVSTNLNGCALASNVQTVTAVDAVTSTLNEEICAGSAYDLNGTFYTSPGTYKDTVPSSNGCDSIITLNLTVYTLNLGVNQSGATLTSSQSGGTYKWIDCSTNQAIPGATSASYTISNTGSYACLVTANNCSDTTDCIVVDLTGIEEQALIESVLIYPNPTKGNLFLDWNTLQMDEISLFDMAGKKLISADVRFEGNTFEMDLSGLANGSYMLEIKSRGATTQRLIQKN